MSDNQLPGDPSLNHDDAAALPGRRRKWLLWLLVLVALGGIGGATAFFLGNRDQQATNKDAPDDPRAIFKDVPPPSVFELTHVQRLLKPEQRQISEPIQNSIGMVLVPIPAGTFTMGSPPRDQRHTPLEAQQRKTISKAFFLGAFEVTQAQYLQVVGRNPSQLVGANHPVESLSWHEASEFCRRLSNLPDELSAKRVYRLPTEPEWEYACRAGTTSAYSFGAKTVDLRNYAWYYDRDSKPQAHVVGQKLPNPWGLYDIHGNVREWCQDSLQANQRVESRVTRGGSWGDGAWGCRCAFRTSDPIDSRSFLIGFRVAMEFRSE